MTKIVVENDLRATIRRALPAARLECQAEAAQNLRHELHDGLGAGRTLNPDTGSLRESLFVQQRDEHGNASSDYSERRNAAHSAYVNGASTWRDIVREVLTEFAYTDEHFEERALDEEELPPEADAAVATFLAYGFWWQMGHFNLFTDQYEKESWFIDPIMRWVKSGMGAAYNDFEAKVRSHL